jgi:hypothetical protein
MFTVPLFGVDRQRPERVDAWSLLMVGVRSARSGTSRSRSYSGDNHPRVVEVACSVTREQAFKAGKKGVHYVQPTEDSQGVWGVGPWFCADALGRFLGEHPSSHVAEVVGVERPPHVDQSHEIDFPGTGSLLVMTVEGDSFPMAGDLEVVDAPCDSRYGCRDERVAEFVSSATFRVPVGELAASGHHSRTAGYLLVSQARNRHR